MMPLLQLGQSGLRTRASQSMVLTSSGDGTTSDVTSNGYVWTVRAAAGDGWNKARCASTRGASDGSFYFEVLVLNVGSASAFAVGIADAGTVTTFSQGSPDNAGDGSRQQYFSDGRKRKNGTYEAYGATYAAGDTIGFGLVKSGTSITLIAYKNGVSQGTMFTFTSSAQFDPHFCTYQNNGALFSATDPLYLPSGFQPWI